jgi:hypothetical protein
MIIQKVVGLVVMVYLNDFSQSTIDTAWPNLGQSMAIGIRVSVHGEGMEPDMKSGVSIGPGAETTLMLTSTKRVRLPPPFQSQCTTQEYADSSKTLKYSVDTCIDLCVQDQVSRRFQETANFFHCNRKAGKEYVIPLAFRLP